MFAAWRCRPAPRSPWPELIRAVWDDDPPRTADKTLQSYVVRLRKAVGSTETGDFGALAIDTVAADAAGRITTDPRHTASIERRAGMDHLDALAFMRDVLNDGLRQDALRHRR